MTIEVSQSDDGRLIETGVGETIAIRLPENASTGFRWAVDRCDGDVLALVAEQPDYAGKTGSAGHVTFSFRAARPGKGEIALKNWRSWEGEKSIGSRFRIEVDVKA